jgi:hypothetical protein
MVFSYLMPLLPSPLSSDFHLGSGTEQFFVYLFVSGGLSPNLILRLCESHHWCCCARAGEALHRALRLRRLSRNNWQRVKRETEQRREGRRATCGPPLFYFIHHFSSRT